MPPTCYYQCICNKHAFRNQKALTLHENACPTVAERDRARYAPYMRRDRPTNPRKPSSNSAVSSVSLPRLNTQEGDQSTAVRQFIYVH
jgi:hypothetical protein